MKSDVMHYNYLFCSKTAHASGVANVKLKEVYVLNKV